MEFYTSREATVAFNLKVHSDEMNTGSRRHYQNFSRAAAITAAIVAIMTTTLLF